MGVGDIRAGLLAILLEYAVVGWQIQALHAASLTQDIKVDKKIIDKARGFLDYAAGGPFKSVYGYNSSKNELGEPLGPGTTLTAIGLLKRYHIDGWRSENRGPLRALRGREGIDEAGTQSSRQASSACLRSLGAGNLQWREE